MRTDQDRADHQRTTAMAPDASTSPLDWSRPIEAVHEDGTIVPVERIGGDGQCVRPDLDGGWFSFKEDGTHLIKLCPWRIRNVQPTTPERDPALWDRMVAYIRADVRDYAQGEQADEGRAILAEIDPIDPDLLAVRQMVADAVPGIDKDRVLRGGFDDTVSIKVPLACLRRGRQLAGEQA